MVNFLKQIKIFTLILALLCASNSELIGAQDAPQPAPRPVGDAEAIKPAATMQFPEDVEKCLVDIFKSFNQWKNTKGVKKAAFANKPAEPHKPSNGPGFEISFLPNVFKLKNLGNGKIATIPNDDAQGIGTLENFKTAINPIFIAEPEHKKLNPGLQAMAATIKPTAPSAEVSKLLLRRPQTPPAQNQAPKQNVKTEAKAEPTPALNANQATNKKNDAQGIGKVKFNELKDLLTTAMVGNKPTQTKSDETSPRLECATKTRAKPAKGLRPPTLHRPQKNTAATQAEGEVPAPAQVDAIMQQTAPQQVRPFRLSMIHSLLNQIKPKSDDKGNACVIYGEDGKEEQLKLKYKITGEEIELEYESGKIINPVKQRLRVADFLADKEATARHFYDAENLPVSIEDQNAVDVSQLMENVVAWSKLSDETKFKHPEFMKEYSIKLPQGKFVVWFAQKTATIGKDGDNTPMIRIDENVKNPEDLEAFVAKKFPEPNSDEEVNPASQPQPQPQPQPQTKLTFDKTEFGTSIATSIAILTTLYLKTKNGSESKSALTAEMITDLSRIASDYTAFANSGKTVIDYGAFSLMVANLIEIISKFSELRKQNKKQKFLENTNPDEAKKAASTNITKLDKIVAVLESALTITRAGIKNWDCQKTSKYLTVAISLIRSQTLYAQANANKKMKALAYTIAAIAIAAAVVDYKKPEKLGAFIN